MDIIIRKPPNLIGDFLGLLPSLERLSLDSHVFLDLLPEAHPLMKIIPSYYNIKLFDGRPENNIREIVIDLDKAFSYARKNDVYMSKAFMETLSLLNKEDAPKADLCYGKVKSLDTPYFLISPFARSLPDNQKWDQHKWQELTNMNSDRTFFVLGNSKYDDEKYLVGENVFNLYDKPFKEVCRKMKGSEGLLSLVTGTSHLAFHLNVKNILLTNQGESGWGINPDSIKITTDIPELEVEEVNIKINK